MRGEARDHVKLCRLPHRVLDPLCLGGLRSLSYHKLPQQLLKLSILKLDGSSFDIFVARNATVAELKEAIEEVFSLPQDDGEGKISWSHIWGHFCLCYDDQKLINDKVHIRNFGVKDGDQLKFIQHMTINYRPVKRQSKNTRGASRQCSISSSQANAHEEEEQTHRNEVEDHSSSKTHLFEDREEFPHSKFKLAHFLSGRLSYSMLRSFMRKESLHRNRSLFHLFPLHCPGGRRKRIQL
ncbi:hypothetical protein NMG60_11004889 [Bertholletia excelsa]